MRSWHHALVSFVVGVGLAMTVETPLPGFAVVVGSVLLGVFVDLDHFLIARARTGSWDALVRCLQDPKLAFVEQGDIFELGDVGARARVVSHSVITVVLGGALAAISRPLALAAVVVLVVHVGCDLFWDRWTTSG